MPETRASKETQANEAQAVIWTSGLTKRYGNFTAVDSLDLTVFRGEIFGLLGPNGAGKTTTILMLLGLTEPTAGQVRVAGFDPVREPLQVKAVVGYLPDNVGFYPHMTGRQNLRYTAALNRIPRQEAEERIQALLEQVGLADAADKRAGTYSRGMRQRLAIADALIKQPSILILDEPTIGIDPEGVKEMLDMLVRLRDERGMTILLSSHLLYQVQAICNRVGIFVGGKLIACGKVSDLEKQLSKIEDVEIELSVVTPDGDEPEAAVRNRLEDGLRSLRKVKDVTLEHGSFIIRATDDVRVEVATLVDELGLVPVVIRRRGMTLDDIYDRYFAEGVSVSRVAV
ncbi:MAG: ABC transporter ATP-binding protein [Thermoleophilia bacterium]|nr:ABC transporter ATP-binding protein [Thermoleophilia bacterium]